MKKKKENQGFVCEYCKVVVLPLSNGSYRNHYPKCLHSKHVDIIPGDRLNDCRSLMAPIGVRYKAGKGYQIIHKCLSCGEIKHNKTAEDTNQPDTVDLILRLCQAY